jgi:hypothetical protein
LALTWVSGSRWSTWFDPALAALLHADPEAILAGLDSTPAWDVVIAAEPVLAVREARTDCRILERRGGAPRRALDVRASLRR